MRRDARVEDPLHRLRLGHTAQEQVPLFSTREPGGQTQRCDLALHLFGNRSGSTRDVRSCQRSLLEEPSGLAAARGSPHLHTVVTEACEVDIVGLTAIGLDSRGERRAATACATNAGCEALPEPATLALARDAA